MAKLVKLEGGKPVSEMSEELTEKLVEVIYEYADRMPLVAAIGCLDLVKKQIVEDAE